MNLKRVVAIVATVCLSLTSFAFAGEDLPFAEDSDMKVRYVSEDEYMVAFAEKNSVTLDDAKVLHQQVLQEYYSGMPKTRDIDYGAFENNISHAYVYKNFKWNKMSIEVGFYCDINAYGSARGFILGSEGSSKVLETGSFYDFSGVTEGEITSTNRARVNARGTFNVFEMQGITFGVDFANFTSSVSGYRRSPVQSFEAFQNL